MKICMLVAAPLAAVVAAGVPSADAAFPGRNGKIAFQRFVSGAFEIYVLDGRTLRNVTRTRRPACEALPAWSPNGRRIAFERNLRGRSEDDSDVWVMDATGRNQRRLTRARGFDGDPAWSPNGKQIVFESKRDGDSEIYVMSSTGARQRRLTRSRGFDGDPAWSPGGGRIAFTSRRDGDAEIYLMDVKGPPNLLNITNNRAADGNPSWSPSGQLVAFDSDLRGNVDIYTTNDRFQLRQLTSHPSLEALPAWSPDGKSIIFASDRAGNRQRDIWTMAADGGSPRRLIGLSSWDTAPDWQPIRSAATAALASAPGTSHVSQEHPVRATNRSAAAPLACTPR
jgi:Tol biopolymer transport system component